MSDNRELIENMVHKIYNEGGLEGAFISYGLSVPNIPELKNFSDLVDKFYESYQELENAYNQLIDDYEIEADY